LNGVYRFDGVRFSPLIPPPGTHLPSSRIQSLMADRDGSLWIGTEAGLAHWNRGQLENYLEQEGVVFGIEQDRGGAGWFSRNSDDKNDSRVLCKVHGAGTACYGSKDGLREQANSTQLVRDDAGYLWMGTLSSVIRWKPSSTLTYPVDALKSSGANGVVALSIDG